MGSDSLNGDITNVPKSKEDKNTADEDDFLNNDLADKPSQEGQIFDDNDEEHKSGSKHANF